MEDPLDFETDLKAKIQLSSELDYHRLLQCWTSPGSAFANNLAKVLVQQEYNLDGVGYPLWKKGLMLGIRRITDVYPVTSSPVFPVTCTTCLKEIIYNNFVNQSDAPIPVNVNDSQSFWESRESEEQVEIKDWDELLNGSPVTSATCTSNIIETVARKYKVPGGIRCLGSSVHIRHIFVQHDLELKLDRCKFPHGNMFFVAFTPEEHHIYNILRFLKENKIEYQINLKSRTALFFQGLVTSQENLLNLVDIPKMVTPLTTLELAQALHHLSDQELKILNTMLTNTTQNSAVTINDAELVNDDVNIKNNELKSSSTVGSSIGSKRAAHGPMPSSKSIKSPKLDSSNSQVEDEFFDIKTKRGRKSLLEKVVSIKEQAENGSDVAIPTAVEEALHELDVDIFNVPKEEIPEVLKQYNKKKNSEASARYRRKKYNEVQELKAELEETRKELEEWKEKYKTLEKLFNETKK